MPLTKVPAPENNHLTRQHLEKFLRDYRQNRTPAQALQQVHFLDSESTLEGRLRRLVTICVQETENRLTELRLADNVPTSATAILGKKHILETLHTDFSSGNQELSAWSALYSRYLAPQSSLDVKQLERAANVSEATFRRRVLEGLDLLCVALERLEIQSLAIRPVVLPSPTYRYPFGLDGLVERIMGLLTAKTRLPVQAPLISIEGIGGIGKTTLADLVVRSAAQLPHFRATYWVTARNEWLDLNGQIVPDPDAVHSVDDVLRQLCRRVGLAVMATATRADMLQRLAPICDETPYLFVIDNLETLLGVESLIPILHRLSRRCRFVITSRERIDRIGQPEFAAMVESIQMPTLDLADSYALVQSELRSLLSAGAETLTPASFQTIYDIVGGIPLALKLLAAQLTSIPLQTTLEDLRQARTRSYSNMLNFIYQQAWNRLSDEARSLLLTMRHLSPEGEDLAWIEVMSMASAVATAMLLRELRQQSLVEVSLRDDRPTYRLHRLTVTFLESEILAQW